MQTAHILIFYLLAPLNYINCMTEPSQMETSMNRD